MTVSVHARSYGGAAGFSTVSDTTNDRTGPNTWHIAFTNLYPTVMYEIRCGSHRHRVSNRGGFKHTYTIPYDWCNSHTAIYTTSERLTISYNEIRRTALQFVVRNSRHEMHAKCNSHLIHILEMVEPARGTKASAHGPWGVYATAWELGWATNTPLQSCTALPTPYSTAQMRCQECRIVVCAQSSAARAAMGHWGNYPHTPGMAGHCLVTLGGHTHTSTTTFGVAHTCRHCIRCELRSAVRVPYGGVHIIFSS